MRPGIEGIAAEWHRVAHTAQSTSVAAVSAGAAAASACPLMTQHNRAAAAMPWRGTSTINRQATKDRKKFTHPV